MTELVKKRISVTLTKPFLDAMEGLESIYVNREEIIKDALRRLFRHYGIEPFGAEKTLADFGEIMVLLV